MQSGRRPYGWRALAWSASISDGPGAAGSQNVGAPQRAASPEFPTILRSEVPSCLQKRVGDDARARCVQCISTTRSPLPILAGASPLSSQQPPSIRWKKGMSSPDCMSMPNRPASDLGENGPVDTDRGEEVSKDVHGYLLRRQPRVRFPSCPDWRRLRQESIAPRPWPHRGACVHARRLTVQSPA